MEIKPKKKYIVIDTYVIEVNNNEYTVSFNEWEGTKRRLSVGKEFIDELMLRKKEEMKYQNEKARHLEYFELTEEEINSRMKSTSKSAEEEMIDRNIYSSIEDEIWKLPHPQNIRVYLKIIGGYSLTKIAHIEKCSVTAIKYSVDRGLTTLKEKLKKQGF